MILIDFAKKCFEVNTSPFSIWVVCFVSYR